jgi:hypothetical protein
LAFGENDFYQSGVGFIIGVSLVKAVCCLIIDYFVMGGLGLKFKVLGFKLWRDVRRFTEVVFYHRLHGLIFTGYAVVVLIIDY